MDAATSVRFLLDEHIPKAVAESLRREGIDVLTLVEAGLLSRSDRELLTQAREAQRVIVTYDSGFLPLGSEHPGHAGIAYCSRKPRTIGQLVEGLLLLHAVYEPAEMTGRVEFI